MVTNEVILSELIPALTLQKQVQVVESLLSLDRMPLNIEWELIRKYQNMNLKNGINKIGIPDLIILQQVIENNLHLFSLDKHFQLMQKHLEFKMFK